MVSSGDNRGGTEIKRHVKRKYTSWCFGDFAKASLRMKIGFYKNGRPSWCSKIEWFSRSMVFQIIFKPQFFIHHDDVAKSPKRRYVAFTFM